MTTPHPTEALRAFDSVDFARWLRRAVFLQQAFPIQTDPREEYAHQIALILSRATMTVRTHVHEALPQLCGEWNATLPNAGLALDTLLAITQYLQISAMEGPLCLIVSHRLQSSSALEEVRLSVVQVLAGLPVGPRALLLFEALLLRDPITFGAVCLHGIARHSPARTAAALLRYCSVAIKDPNNVANQVVRHVFESTIDKSMTREALIRDLLMADDTVSLIATLRVLRNALGVRMVLPIDIDDDATSPSAYIEVLTTRVTPDRRGEQYRQPVSETSIAAIHAIGSVFRSDSLDAQLHSLDDAFRMTTRVTP